MSDLALAIAHLKQDNTCVVCLDERIIYSSQKKGIVPVLNLIDNNIPVNNASVADKIIGKAAALLFSICCVSSVYGEVMSKEGYQYLVNKGIKAEYGQLVDKIINRNHTGICPMEETVLNIDDAQQGYQALKAKVQSLSNSNKQ